MPYIKKLMSNSYVDNVDLWEAVDEVAECLGSDEMLTAICKAVGNDYLKDLLKGIIRDYDLNQEEEEEQEEC